VKLLVKVLAMTELCVDSASWLLTLGRLTLGTMTSLRAEGASLRGLLVSPPGWYWYLASPPVFQGSESTAMATGFSDEEEVGLREKCQPARPKAPDMMVSRICVFAKGTCQ
jgi:hypothetical protein